MKRLFVLIALSMTATVNAQEENIQAAVSSLSNNEFEKAIEFIDLAAEHPTTKSDPKTWFTMGNIYIEMQQYEKYKNDPRIVKALDSYIKLAKLFPEYETDKVKTYLKNIAQQFYQIASNYYSSGEMSIAYQASQKAVEIYDINNGNYFKEDKLKDKSFSKMIISAKVVHAQSVYYEKEQDALPLLLNLRDNSDVDNAAFYGLIYDIYQKQKNKVKQLAIIEEGLEKYPSDKRFKRIELKYYMEHGDQDQQIQKLEQTLILYPDDPILHYNLATVCFNMALPNNARVDAPKPENYKELIAKAEAGFKKAMELDPKNTEYKYNLGVLYYNQAYIMNGKVNEANTDSEYERLKAARDRLFEKALSYYEEVYSVLGPNPSAHRFSRVLYVGLLKGLIQIYTTQKKTEKADEIKQVLKTL